MTVEDQGQPASADGSTGSPASRRFASRFVLLRSLGRGGMGEVFLARELVTHAECALKRLDGQVATGISDLAREFESLARIHHPAVVRVHEFGVAPDGTPFYTMEFVPGEPADRAVEPGDWAAWGHVAAEVVHALEILHAAGIAHGDLKPANVMVRAGAGPAAPPEVKLLDFGLASLLDGIHRGGRGHAGTPGFAAPERVRGAPPDVASDLYGLGATLYALAVGRSPFEGDRLEAILGAQQAGPPDGLALDDAGVPAAVKSLVLRLMAPEPKDRPRDAREVREEIEHLFPAVRRPLAARLRNAVFVGREREFARIEQFAAARTGSRLVFVTGDSGMGKSAWLGEVATRASLAGRSVVRLSCATFEGPGALAEALARRLAAESGGDLSPPEGDALVDAAAGWLERIGRRGLAPVVLLDDAERLDPVSARLLRRLGLHPSPERWLVVLAGGREGAETIDPGRLLRDGGAMHEIEIGPLDRDGVEALVAARLRARAPEPLVDALWSHAQGHPGLTVELLALAASTGTLREIEGGLVVDADALRSLGEAGDFVAVVAARLKALPDAARATGEALAVWGEPVDAARLAAVEAAADEAAVAALVEARLCARDEAGRVAWASPSVAEWVAGHMDGERRRRLHEAILAQPGLSAMARFRHLAQAGHPLDALAAADEGFALRPDAGMAERAARLAEREGLEGQAARWWDRCARGRFEDGRYPAAIEAFSAALDRGLAGAARAESLHMLALSLNRAVRLDDSETRAREGLALDPPPALKAKLMAAEAAAAFLRGDLSRAEARARDAVSVADSSEDAEAIGWAAHALGLTLVHSGRSDEAEPLFRRSEQAFRAAGHPLGVVRAKLGLSVVVRNRGTIQDALGLFEQALDDARSSGNRLALTEALGHIVTALVPLGRWKEARAILLETVRLAFEDQRPATAVSAVVNLSIMEGLMGRPRVARSEARRGLRLIGERLDRLTPTTWRALAQADRIAGRLASAERAARRALLAAQRTGEALDLCWARIEYGRVLGQRGAWDEARRVWNVAADRGPVGDPIGAALVQTLAGRGAVLAGDIAGARTRLAQAEAIVGTQSAPYARAHAGALAAAIALVEGRSLAAKEAATSAREWFSALPAPSDRAEMELELAGIALRRAPAGELPVGEWIDEASATFERLGNLRSTARARALQLQWIKRSEPRTTVAGKERDLLGAVSRLLDSILDLRELSHRAMRLAVEQLGAERGVLLLADSDNGQLMPIAEHGAMDAESRREAVGYSRQVAEQVAASGGSLLIGDAPAEPGSLSKSMVDLHLRSIVCVPMFRGGKVIGAVYLDDSRRSDAFGDAERALLEGFAHLMAVAIEKSRGHDEVQRANVELVGENISLRQEVAARFRTDRLIGSSDAMRKVLTTIERAAASGSTALITGENGTGKELIARVMHHASKRRMRPFIAVNCGAIPEQLLESELFGILPNVATGVHGREGRFRQADGGTLFLDEIGDMPLSQQVALLSVLSNRWITPVGGHKPIPVDVWVIAATNQDLRQMIQEKTFREDLFYRLNVIPIEVPPLRERKADIPSLAHHFVAHYAKLQERPVPEMSPEFLAALMQSDWPGNIRELQNYIERVLAMTPGRVLYPTPPPRDLESRLSVPASQTGRRLTDIVDDLDRRLVEEALQTAGWNQSLAARELGMTEQAIRYRVRKYGLSPARQKRRSRQKQR